MASSARRCVARTNLKRMKNLFQEIEVRGARRALHTLALGSKELNSSIGKYMFRGQGDANWEALPAAFRPDAKMFGEHALYPIGKRTNRDQVHAELFMLEAFARELNQVGLYFGDESVLNISGIDYQRFHNEVGRSETIWPPSRFHGVMALAQHSGMPTRLLDWSWDPYVALYFAARKALEIQSDYFAVYALNSLNILYSGIENNSASEYLSRLSGKQRMRREYCLVQTPSHLNHNLRAQKGFFLTYVEAPFRANDGFEPMSVDKLAKDADKTGIFRLKKFIVPTVHAKELLILLSSKFYNATMLFPGYEGAIAGLNDKYLSNLRRT